MHLRRGAQLDILIVMNRPRYRGAIRAFRPPPLRAEFVSHTTRRRNSSGSCGKRTNANNHEARDGEVLFLLPIITHGGGGEGRGRIDDDVMTLLRGFFCAALLLRPLMTRRRDDVDKKRRRRAQPAAAAAYQPLLARPRTGRPPIHFLLGTMFRYVMQVIESNLLQLERQTMPNIDGKLFATLLAGRSSFSLTITQHRNNNLCLPL